MHDDISNGQAMQSKNLNHSYKGKKPSKNLNHSYKGKKPSKNQSHPYKTNIKKKTKEKAYPKGAPCVSGKGSKH
jgi:hypothetical protein